MKLNLRNVNSPPIFGWLIIISTIVPLVVTVIGISTLISLRQGNLASTTTSTTITPEAVIPDIKTVTALGKIEPQGEVIQLSAAISSEGSRVQKLLVKEGANVKSGQVIAILDNYDRLQAALTEAQAGTKVAQANLNRIQAGAKWGERSAQKAIMSRLIAERQADIDTQLANISRIQAELENAQVEFKRYKTLYTEGAISASQLDSKRLTLKTAQKSLQVADAQLNRIRLSSQQRLKEADGTLNQISEVRPVDLAVAKAEIARAQATEQKAKTNLEQAYIRSPESGQVLEIHTHPGELISSAGIVDIGQTQQMYAVAEVYETDIRKLHIGQKVHVIDEVLNLDLQGIVERIGLQVHRQNVVSTDPYSNIDNRVVRVHVRLNQSSSQQAASLTNMQVKVIFDV